MITQKLQDLAMGLTTLGDWLQWAEGEFERAALHYGHGTDNAWDEAVAIARYVLHLPVDVQKSIAQSRLTDEEKEKLMALFIERVEKRMPVAYLTRQAWFANLRFCVDDRVLIPRSPLAELINKHFAPWVIKPNVQDICDIGTGSACIAIACAKAFPCASVDAVDISKSALEIANQNVREHDVLDRVHLWQGNLFEPLAGRRYDVIISNPPYVGKEEMQSLPAEYKHEPTLGLAAGQDGLDIVIPLLANAADHIQPSGILILEVGNSMDALMRAFTDVDFIWLDFEYGGDGVCLLTAAQLHTHQETFIAAMNARFL